MIRTRSAWFAPALVGLSFAASLLLTPLVGRAQSEFGAAIMPDRCQVEPLTDAELVDIVDAAASPATPVSALDGESEPLPEDLRQPIIDTIVESVACTNANDPMRAFALFTDRYLQTRFTGEGADDLGHLLVAITRESAPAAEIDRLALISIDEFQVWPDGAVSVTVVTGNVDATYTDTLVLVEVDEVWLIDQAITTEPNVPATPSA